MTEPGLPVTKLGPPVSHLTKYVLDLAFICDQTHRNRLMELNLLPISWLARVFRYDFLFSVLPEVLVTRTTRSNSNRYVTHFISGKCNSVTFQRSFFFNRTTRIWNTLADDFQLSFNLQISQFKSIMYKYYLDALEHNYDQEHPRSWNWPSVGNVTFLVTCLSVFVVVLNCHM